jgi:hypothetical protein
MIWYNQGDPDQRPNWGINLILDIQQPSSSYEENNLFTS